MVGRTVEIQASVRQPSDLGLAVLACSPLIRLIGEWGKQVVFGLNTSLDTVLVVKMAWIGGMYGTGTQEEGVTIDARFSVF